VRDPGSSGGASDRQPQVSPPCRLRRLHSFLGYSLRVYLPAKRFFSFAHLERLHISNKGKNQIIPLLKVKDVNDECLEIWSHGTLTSLSKDAVSITRPSSAGEASCDSTCNFKTVQRCAESHGIPTIAYSRPHGIAKGRERSSGKDLSQLPRRVLAGKRTK
jgi:hypothetical protein